jgi:Tol biopolymer transport system component
VGRALKPALVILGLLSLWGPPAAARASVTTTLLPTWTTRASMAGGEVEADRGGDSPSISRNGRYVAFVSDSTNLVPNPQNYPAELFLRDRQDKTTIIVSAADDGSQGNTSTGAPCGVTARGRYVAFQSQATNLVPGAGNGFYPEVYVRDTVSGTTVLASVAPDGSQFPRGADCSAQAISDDGRYLVFNTWDTNLWGWMVYLRDLQAGTTTALNIAPDGHTIETGTEYAYPRPVISGDGSHAVFRSDATGLVSPGPRPQMNLFERDLARGRTKLVSRSFQGRQGNGPSDLPSISGDGRFVEFVSTASNLVLGDTNRRLDMFVRDVKAGTTVRVDVSTAGVQSGLAPLDWTGSISRDGRYVAFSSDQGTMVVDCPALAPRQNVFLHDLGTGLTTMVSLNSRGSICDVAMCGEAASISGNGRYVAFTSDGSNLVPGDSNGYRDVFVRDVRAPLLQPNAAISVGWSGPYAGLAMCNTTGRNQAVSLLVPPGQERLFFIRVENDGNLPDDFQVAGPGSTRTFSVRYFFGSLDVTWEVVTGSFRLTLSPARSEVVRLEVKARARALRGRKGVWLVRATSRLDPTEVDAVLARAVTG